jgi:hypothetical protein
MKLEESLKSLESNANMIQWLNKQLNEKQTSTASGLYSGSTQGYISSLKPPPGNLSSTINSKFPMQSSITAKSPTANVNSIALPQS